MIINAAKKMLTEIKNEQSNPENLLLIWNLIIYYYYFFKVSIKCFLWKYFKLEISFNLEIVLLTIKASSDYVLSYSNKFSIGYSDKANNFTLWL